MDEEGKMFVGGLSWETSKEELKEYFERFGEVADSVVMTDSVTKKPRGFGFVTFRDPEKIKEVENHSPHTINDRTVDPKRATMRERQTPGAKIFVGGLDTQVTEEQLRAYFAEFGDVRNVDLKSDKQNPERSRGFGFVEFESSEVVAALVETRYHKIGTKTAEVKLAEPKSASTGQAGGGGATQVQPGYPYPQSGSAVQYGGGYSRGHYGSAASSGYGQYSGYYPQYGYGHYGYSYHGSPANSYHGSSANSYHGSPASHANSYHGSPASHAHGSYSHDTRGYYGSEGASDGSHSGYSAYNHPPPSSYSGSTSYGRAHGQRNHF